MNTPTPFVTWIMEQTDSIGLNGENIVQCFIEQRFGVSWGDSWLPYVQRIDAFGKQFWVSELGCYLCKSDESTTLHEIQDFITQTYGENTP